MKWKHRKIVNERFLEFSFNNFSDSEKKYPRRWTLRLGLVLHYSTLCPWTRLYIDPLEKLIHGSIHHIPNKSNGSIYPVIFIYNYDQSPDDISAFWFNCPLY